MDFHEDRNFPGHFPIFQEHTYLGVTFSEAAGLLLLWSVLVVNEGALRYTNLISSNGSGLLDFGDGQPANGLLFITSLSEVIFGLMGILLGVAGFICRFYNTRFVQACMSVQLGLSFLVFIVYVFIRPFMQLSLVESSPLPNISLGLYRFLTVLGVFTSAHFCLAMQGGQFVFMARLVSAATGEDFLWNRTGDRMRAAFWSMNITLAGFWTLLTGCIVHARMGAGKVVDEFEFPPNVGRLPGLTVTTGLIMFLFGTTGVAFSLMDTIAPQVYYVAALFVFVLSWINYTIGQFPYVGPEAGAVSMHSGLVFTLVFMSTYFVWCYSKETGFSDDKI